MTERHMQLLHPDWTSDLANAREQILSITNQHPADTDRLGPVINRNRPGQRVEFRQPIAVPLPFAKTVKTVTAAQIAALDSTARLIGTWVLNRDVKRLPYYPKASTADQFDGSLQSQLPGLAKGFPDIAEAFRRHQAFQPGRGLLGLLYQLARTRRANGLPLEYRLPSGDRASGDREPDVGMDDIYFRYPGLALSDISAVDILGRIQDLVEHACREICQTAGIVRQSEHLDQTWS